LINISLPINYIRVNITAKEIDPERTTRHRQGGRYIVTGDSTDSTFGGRLRSNDKVRLVIMATSKQTVILQALTVMKELAIEVKTAALYKFADEAAELESMGVDFR